MRKMFCFLLIAFLSIPISNAQFNRTYSNSNYRLESYAVMHNDNTDETFTASRMAMPVTNANYGILLLNTDNAGNINHEYFLEDVSISAAHLAKTYNDDVILAYTGTSNVNGNYRIGLHIICFASDFSAIHWDFFTPASANGFEKADIAIGRDDLSGLEEYYFGYTLPNGNGTDESTGIVKIDETGTVIFNNLYESNPRPAGVYTLRDDFSGLTFYDNAGEEQIAVTGVRREDFHRDIFAFSIRKDGTIAEIYRHFRAITPGYMLGAWVPDITWDGNHLALIFGSQYPPMRLNEGSFTLMRLNPSLDYVDGRRYAYGTSENLGNAITYSPDDGHYHVSAYVSHAAGGAFTNMWYIRESDLGVTSLHLFNASGTDEPMYYNSHTTSLTGENYLVSTKEYNSGMSALRMIRTDASGGDLVCGNVPVPETISGAIDYANIYHDYIETAQPFPMPYSPDFLQISIGTSYCEDAADPNEYKGRTGSGVQASNNGKAPSLYPNIVSGNEQIRIEFPNLVKGVATLHITNTVGQVVSHQSYALSGNTILFSAGTLQNGFNILTATVDGEQYIFKILKK